LLTKRFVKFNDFIGSYLIVFHFLIFVLLTWLGGCVVEWPYRRIGGVVRMIYFLMFFI
jgi:hypothetical protein